jgi:transposase-like protein
MPMPAKFKPEFVQKVELACKLGATDEEIATLFDVNRASIVRWRIDHPEFAKAFKAGKEVSDDRVERSLFQCAVGYEYEEEKAFLFEGNIVKERVKKFAPPQAQAQIFWLKNRRPDLWRDVQKHELGRAGEFSQVPDDKLLELIKEETQIIEGELVETSSQD